MINPIRCMHCGTKTRTVYQSVKSSFRESVIVVSNAPMHYCHNCNENLISIEALQLFRYLKTLPLKKGINEFDFETAFRQVKVV